MYYVCHLFWYELIYIKRQEANYLGKMRINAILNLYSISYMQEYLKKKKYF